MDTPTRSLRVFPSDTLIMEVRIHSWLHFAFVSEGRDLSYLKSLFHKRSHRKKHPTSLCSYGDPDFSTLSRYVLLSLSKFRNGSCAEKHATDPEVWASGEFYPVSSLMSI